MENLDIDCAILILLAMADEIKKNECKNEKNTVVRSQWVRTMNLTRDVHGFFSLNYEMMQKDDPEHFFKITRMSPSTFDLLEKMVEPHLEKTSWRKAISPKCRLFVTLM